MAGDNIPSPVVSSNELLVEILGNNQLWSDLAEAFNEVMSLNVDQLIFELERIRFIRQDSDQELLKSTARMLGFNATQDVLNLNSDSLTRLVSQLPLYPDQNSTEYFVNFIDVLLNSSVKVGYLYTKDYVNFTTTLGGTLITDGGEWFKTTHIELTIALLNLSSLLLNPGETLLQRAIELFYAYSPIPLVIEKLRFAVVIDDWPGGSAFGMAAKIIGGRTHTILE